MRIRCECRHAISSRQCTQSDADAEKVSASMPISCLLARVSGHAWPRTLRQRLRDLDALAVHPQDPCAHGAMRAMRHASLAVEILQGHRVGGSLVRVSSPQPRQPGVAQA